MFIFGGKMFSIFEQAYFLNDYQMNLVPFIEPRAPIM